MAQNERGSKSFHTQYCGVPDVQMFSLSVQFSPGRLYGNELFIHVIPEDFEVQLLVFGSCFCIDFSKS